MLAISPIPLPTSISQVRPQRKAIRKPAMTTCPAACDAKPKPSPTLEEIERVAILSDN